MAISISVALRSEVKTLFTNSAHSRLAAHGIVHANRVAAGGNSWLATAELYDPSARTFTPTANMTAPRAYHTATLLQNGDVLIAGGLSGLRGANTAEIYHAATGTFSPTARPMVTARAYHTSTLLSNGEVDLRGGARQGSCLPVSGGSAPNFR